MPTLSCQPASPWGSSIPVPSLSVHVHDASCLPCNVCSDHHISRIRSKFGFLCCCLDCEPTARYQHPCAGTDRCGRRPALAANHKHPHSIHSAASVCPAARWHCHCQHILHLQYFDTHQQMHSSPLSPQFRIRSLPETTSDAPVKRTVLSTQERNTVLLLHR